MISHYLHLGAEMLEAFLAIVGALTILMEGLSAMMSRQNWKQVRKDAERGGVIRRGRPF